MTLLLRLAIELIPCIQLLVLLLLDSSSTRVQGFCMRPAFGAPLSTTVTWMTTPPTAQHSIDLPDDVPGGGGGAGDDSSDSSATTRSFAQGDDLYKLRQRLITLYMDLETARRGEDSDSQRVRQLEHDILEAQEKDAEFVYEMSLDKAIEAEQRGDSAAAELYRKTAELARGSLRQFNLEGLWVGKYGNTEKEQLDLINVTYDGDVLVARKVTGERNVPKGQVSFQVDLNTQFTRGEKALDAVKLDDAATEQWGVKYLSRFHGQGQVAGPGFVDPQWKSGQLILINQHFSFAWVPLNHQIFFSRPSLEVIVKLLSESKYAGLSDAHAWNRDYLERCMEETLNLDDDMEASDGLFRSHDQRDYYKQRGCFD